MNQLEGSTTTQATTPTKKTGDFKLFPYQQIGADWLASRKLALLADEMGLGKSAQSITAADFIAAKRVLIICPAIARINWLREFQMFSTYTREFQIVRDRRETWDLTTSTIASYDSCLYVKDSGNYDVMILDEAHFLKSLDAKRSLAVLGKNGIIRKCARTWALSGTPATNHAGELWTLLFTFGITPLSYDQWVKKYCDSRQTGFGLQILGTKVSAIPELKQLLSKIMLRRRKEEVMTDLPPIHFGMAYVERGEVDIALSPDWLQYQNRPEALEEKLKKERDLVDYVFREQTASGNGLRALEALAPSVSTLRRYTALQKVQAIYEVIVDELENKAYEKLVIFAIHRDVIELLRMKLAHYGCLTLYGGQDDNKKQKNIDLFQNSKKKRIMIANIHAAGTSITLTAAHNVIFAEQDWVPGNNAQAVMRCHRIGQKNPVSVRVFCLAESIDELVSKALKRKTEQLTEIFGS